MKTESIVLPAKNEQPRDLGIGSGLQSILVVLNSICLYGMERAIFETFDLLRDQVNARFLIPRANERYQTAMFAELQAASFLYSFFGDTRDWPRIGKPKSLRHLWRMLWSLGRANVDVMKHIRQSRALYLPNIVCVYYSLLACVYCRLTGRRVIYVFHDLITKRSRRFWLVAILASDIVHNTGRSEQVALQSNPFLRRTGNHVMPPRIAIRRSPSFDASPGETSETSCS